MPAHPRISWRLPLSAAIASAIVGLAFASSPADEPAAGPAANKPTPEAVEFFEKRVRPLLVAHCQKCHGAEEQKGGLRLDSRAAILAGGDSGPAVVPGKVNEGLLLDAVAYGDLFQMPPSGKLPDADLETLRQWVALGAPWPAEDAKAAGPKASVFDLAERAKHWAFQGLVAHDPPIVKDTSWSVSPIDHFILARLEAAGLSPALSADRATLLRRLSFDLVGLPPTPAEVQAFQADDSPQAIERVVDLLLASPHYGERWARHWLDLVRYAESRGHEFDYPIPNAYQYRDYVIRAFNRDLPYNQFVTEQVAGDLLEHPRLNPERGFNESILGTGFWFLGEEVHSPVDIRSDETDRNDNKIDVFSKTFLGLTVACARCHDHKFDAISTKDYYALAGFMLSSGYRQAAFESLEPQRTVAHEMQSVRQAARPQIAGRVAAAAQPVLARTAELLLAARELLLASRLGAPTTLAEGGGEKPPEQQAADAAN
jgi:cytochrome c553